MKFSKQNFDQDNNHLMQEFEFALENSDKKALLKSLEQINVADLALVLSDYRDDKKAKFSKLVANNFPPELFLKFNDAVCEEFLLLAGKKKAATLLSKLEVAEIIAILDELPEDFKAEIFGSFSKTLQKELATGFNYPSDSVGRLLHRNFLSVPAHWSLAQVNKYCFKNKKLLDDNFYGVFVIDHLYRPIGIVTTQQLVLSPHDTKIKDVMHSEIGIFHHLASKDDVAILFQKYDLTFAPIVNNDGRIIGFITIDDVLDVVDAAAEEDILYLGGIYESDIFTKFSKTLKQRLPWLILNLMTAILASIVISFFDDTIESLVALAVLMPIIASMGGNAGTQTVTVAVRALATQELNKLNTSKIILKETLIGFCNGVFFALLCFAALFLIYDNYTLAMLFAIANIITLTIAGFSGAAIPIILNKLKADPAISSGVILTTITDVIAFLAFLGLATIFIAA